MDRGRIPLIDLDPAPEPIRWDEDGFAVPAPVDLEDFDRPDPVVLRLMDQAPEPTPHQLNSDKFLDTNTVKDFECIICLDIVYDHYKSQTCRDCLVSMCPSSCLKAFKEANPSYVRKCPACRSPFRYRNRPRTGPKSIEQYESLQVYCSFSPSCQQILTVRQYLAHVNDCVFNVSNCPRCSSKGGNQDIHLGYCMDELSSLHAELATKRQSLTRAAITIEVQRQQIENLERKISELEGQQSKGLQTVSNPVRSTKEHDGKYTKFTVKYLDQTFQIENIALDDPGSVLRAEIEKVVGRKVGAILRSDHTFLNDEKRLRQHQFCYKPTFITALQSDFSVDEGSRLNVRILSRGEQV